MSAYCEGRDVQCRYSARDGCCRRERCGPIEKGDGTSGGEATYIGRESLNSCRQYHLLSNVRCGIAHAQQVGCRNLRCAQRYQIGNASVEVRVSRVGRLNIMVATARDRDASK